MHRHSMDALMYNESAKTRYLERYRNKDTKEVYGRIFKKSALLEYKHQKDLCNFTEEQLKQFVIDILQPKTKESSRSIYSTISSYIDWAIQEGISSHEENPWHKRSTDYIYSLVIPVKNYMSFQEKQYVLKTLVNAQDKFIVEALWNGIQGDKLIELITLKMEQVNPTLNKVVITDDQNRVKREVIAFDEQLCDLALMANEQRLYVKKNGQCSENTISEHADLVNSDYIIKHSNTKHRGNRAYTTHYTVYNRIEMFRSLNELQQFSNVLVTKNIVRSGMIYWAKQIYLRDRLLGRSQIEEVCARFNARFKWSMKDFLNIEMIMSLYPELLLQKKAR